MPLIRQPRKAINDQVFPREAGDEKPEKLGFQRAFNLFAMSAVALVFGGGALVLVFVAVYGLIFE